ncbi:MAG: pectinesterase family protein [Myxococcota bacterium]
MLIRKFAQLHAPSWLQVLTLCSALACSSKNDSDSGSGGASSGGNANGGSASESGGSSPANGGSGNAGGGSGNANGGSAAANGGAAGNATGGVAGSAGNAGSNFGGSAAPGPCVLPTAVVPAGSDPIQPAAAAVPSTPTRPQLEQALADERYTIAKFLEAGGTVAATYTSSGTTNTTPAASIVDNWDPVTNGIGDPASFTPMFTVAKDGSGTHTTVLAALAAATNVSGCARVYILVKPDTYRENMTLTKNAPPVTLYSTEADASKTVIVFNNAAGTMLTGATGTLGTSGSATFTNNAAGLQLKNLTIANDFVEGTFNGTSEQAVAFLSQGDKLQCENVRFLGNQDTLYLKSVNAGTIARSYLRDCYIEGDTDFIFGRGTAVFDHCEVKTVGTVKTSGTCAAAPSTEVTNPYGFLFISSQFTADANVTSAFFARQWFEGTRESAVGKMIVRNSTIGAHINPTTPWKAWSSRSSPKTPTASSTLILYTSDDYYAADGPTPPEPYIAEYGNQ